MMKVLVDTSTHHHADAIKAKWVDTGTSLWGGVVPIQTGYLASEEKQYEIRSKKGGVQTRYIAALAQAFREEKIDAYTTDALMIERYFQGNVGGAKAASFGSTNYGDASLFANVAMKQVNTLEGFSFVLPGDNPMQLFREYLRQSSDEVFADICSALAEVVSPTKISQDAWHLRCTIVLGMDVFLCVDPRLVGQVESIRDKKLRKQLREIISLPSELCSKLGLEPMSDHTFTQFAAIGSGFPLDQED